MVNQSQVRLSRLMHRIHRMIYRDIVDEAGRLRVSRGYIRRIATGLELSAKYLRDNHINGPVADKELEVAGKPWGGKV